jgi:DNA invertase Pin-like site-specific DNA recombinase
MPKTKISWEEHPQGTVTAWIDRETREIVRQDGEPNIGYILEWKGELKRMQVSTKNAEYGDPVYLQFKEKDRPDVILAKTLHLEGLSYELIGRRIERSRSTVYRWLKTLGLVNKRGK